MVARLAFPETPMPLSLTTEEMDLLLTLAAPIEHRNLDQFLRGGGRARGGLRTNRRRARLWRRASGRPRGAATVFRPAAIAEREQDRGRLKGEF